MTSGNVIRALIALDEIVEGKMTKADMINKSRYVIGILEREGGV